MQKVLTGIRPAVVALILVAALILGREAIVDWTSVAISGGVLLLVYGTRIHPLVLLAGSAIIGLILYGG